MTQISDTYNAIVTIAGAALSGHSRIPNPYDLASNPDKVLQKGWGITIGSASNSQRHLSNILTLSRDFSVIISRQLIATDLSATGRATVEKTLMEDAILVANDIEADPNLSAAAMRAVISGDSGIEFISSGDYDGYGYLFTTLIISVEYRETLT